MDLPKIKHIDLFTGIGGFALAAQRVWKERYGPILFCEKDEFCQKVLKKHWPNVPIHNDITTLRVDKYEKQAVDIITGGFPCQDLSANGKRVGIEGARSGLWEELKGAIGTIRPKYALMENVTNLLMGESGAWYGKVLSDLAQVGYDAQWYCIPASSIGCNHRRDRVYILAYPTSKRWDEVAFHNCLTLEHKRISRQYCSASNQKARRLSKADICGENDGIPYWMDRLRALGNAIVPQIAEIIFSAIKKVEESETRTDGVI